MQIREMRVVYGRGVSVNGHEGPLKIANGRDAAAVMRPLLASEVVEVGYVLCLNTRNRLIGYQEVSRGTLDATVMHPREVFKVAVLANAAGIVLVHNHPSGDPTPSPDDVALTGRLRSAGRILGIELLDHVIVVAGDEFVSMREQGRL